VVLQLRSIDYHYIICVSDLGNSQVKPAWRKRDDPEREHRRGWLARIHGCEVRPFQGAPGWVRVHKKHTLPGLDENVRQPYRWRRFARAWLKVQQSYAESGHLLSIAVSTALLERFRGTHLIHRLWTM
jgi:hypothetical protein